MLWGCLLVAPPVPAQYYPMAVPVPVPVPVPQPYGYGIGSSLPYGGYGVPPIGGYSRTSYYERRGGVLG
ncbi:hypothetical protein J6590_077669 [Homalodisca vitripennis]|nr:hypothetical protein J6590_077669 [Homalodisca vitripennis]